MIISETELTEDVLARLIELSRVWEAENSCHGYRANERNDVEGNRVFTATEDGIIVGYLFGHIYEQENHTSVLPKSSKCFEVEEIYVLPSHRSRGIGKALFEYMEQTLRSEADYISLTTATKDHKAILHFYIDELGMDFGSARLTKKL